MQAQTIGNTFFPGTRPQNLDSCNSTDLYGYTCGGCGIWFPTGAWHACGANPTFATYGTSPPSSPRCPHKCPVCEGRGQVPFDPAEPLATSRDRSSWPCRPCFGSGVLWS